MHALRFSFALALCLACFVPVVSAQDAAGDEEARGLFLAGQAAFEAARYEDALSHFRSAYARSPRPELLYNVALAADRLRLDEEALDAFERFLALASPEAHQRRDVEARVAVLRASLAARASDVAPVVAEEAEEEPAIAAPVTIPETRDDGATIGGWSLVGAGSALAFGGAILLGIGRAEAARVEDAAPGTPWTDVAGAAANAEWMSPLGIAVLALGATAVAGGALWLALDRPHEEEHTLRVGLGLGTLYLGGTL